ncbi:MAG: methyltransferase domain-containing protein [Clostridiaceae bacterium]
MLKQRVIETNDGIQDALDVQVFDRFARNMRDKGWNNVESIIGAGVTGKEALEIGPGPGYVGLEWLKRCENAVLTGCEISPEMIRLAQRNAETYGFSARVCYVEGNAMRLPFADESFDAVFSNGSLHEWEDAVAVFSEIGRVLRPGGRYCITDMRRDVNPLLAKWIGSTTKPKEIRPGFWTSLDASYTVSELEALLKTSALRNAAVKAEFFGLCVSGGK